MKKKSNHTQENPVRLTPFSNKIKKVCLHVGVLYFTFYIPFAFIAYLPFWYNFNNQFHQRFNLIGKTEALNSVDELTHFLRGQGELSGLWSVKEQHHLMDVRDIFQVLFLVALFMGVLLFFFWDGKKMAAIAKINMIVTISSGFLLFIFNFFWVHIFHPLLFSNDSWKLTPGDRLFYITPRSFFRNSLILLLFVSTLINMILWVLYRKKR